MDRSALRSAELPVEFAGAPDQMSFSALRSMEDCPRRWALSRAEYPDIWPGHGYPPLVTWAALRGTIVHRSSELILKQVERECGTGFERLSAALENLGGYSAVLKRCYQQARASNDSNPRFGAGDQFDIRFASSLSELRVQVQRLIGTIHVAARATSTGEAGKDLQSHAGAHTP